jgi:hypothetical protein
MAGECLDYAPPPSGGDSLYQWIAQQHVGYAYNIVPSNWMGQYALWEAIQADSTLVDSSATIAVFATLAQNSRYNYITTMENALANGYFDSVTTMLSYNIDSMANTAWDTVTQTRMADSTAADNIVQNYQSFFGLYMKYMTQSLSSGDSLQIMALAQLCPERNGTVVFQARALYSEIFGDLTMFNDDSCMDLDSTYIAERHGASPSAQAGQVSTQKYALYPNPNDGNLWLSQYLTDNKPVVIDVWNALGQRIYHQMAEFSSGRYDVKLGSIPPGVYLLVLKDNAEREFRFRFVVE